MEMKTPEERIELLSNPLWSKGGRSRIPWTIECAHIGRTFTGPTSMKEAGRYEIKRAQ